jgi:hypothetical protein
MMSRERERGEGRLTHHVGKAVAALCKKRSAVRVRRSREGVALLLTRLRVDEVRALLLLL